MTQAVPAFRRGAEEAEKASKSGQFARTSFFGIDDQESAIVRFMTDMDQWIVVNQHSNVPTRPRPPSLKKDANWPEKMGGVCRRDVAFAEIGFPDCYICDFVKKPDGKPNKATGRNWGLGCLREEVRDEAGQLRGYKDKMRKVAQVDKEGNPTGAEIEEKDIVVFNMGFKNFLSTLKGYAAVYGTLLDRDYLIKRSGTELDTTYTIIPLSEIPGYDLRNPEIAEKYKTNIDLGAEILHRASDEFYARFFDVRMPYPDDANKTANGQGAPPAQQSKPQSDVDDAELAALAARVRGHDGAPPAAAATEPVQEPAAAAAPGGLGNFEG